MISCGCFIDYMFIFSVTFIEHSKRTFKSIFRDLQVPRSCSCTILKLLLVLSYDMQIYLLPTKCTNIQVIQAKLSVSNVFLRKSCQIQMQRSFRTVMNNSCGKLATNSAPTRWKVLIAPHTRTPFDDDRKSALRAYYISSAALKVRLFLRLPSLPKR